MLRLRVRTTGAERWVAASATPVLDERGQPELAISIFREITAEKRTQDGVQFLAQASTALTASLDYDATLTTVAQLAVPWLATWCFVDAAQDDGTMQTMKYSPDGAPILVRIDVQEGRAMLAVIDHGIGIPATDLPQIFTRFYRASNVDDGMSSGLGLGLSVIRELVALHGGTIAVQSDQGQGSTFTVSLPLSPSAPAERE